MSENKHKWGMLINVAKCTGCMNCFLACKDENCLYGHEGYTAPQPMTGQKWIDVREVERGTFPKVKLKCIPIPCMHCDKPDCMHQAQGGAVYKREDGIVIIDPEKSKGQKDIVNTCPYRAIFWNEELQIPQKCDMCAHLLDRGFTQTRCSEMCPTSAILFGDLNDPESEISKEMAKSEPGPMHPEYGMRENVVYLNLPTIWVTGTVLKTEIDRCVEGAKVTLEGPDGYKAEAVTDAFGDFWFDNLESKADYSITVEAEGRKSVSLKTHTYTCMNVGDIYMQEA